MRERKKWSDDEKQKLVAEVDGKIGNGMSIKQAAKSANINDIYYRRWKKSKVQISRKKMPQMIEIPLADNKKSSPMIVLMGKTDAVTQAVEALSRIYGG